MISLVLAILFTQGELKQPPLIDAINRGSLADATSLLKAGANPNTKEVLVSKPHAAQGIQGGVRYDGDTALMKAVSRRSLPFVNLLLTYKADPNARGPYGYTALMTAGQMASAEMIKVLLHHGAKPNLVNEMGDTAIIFAANRDVVKGVQALVEAGANMNGGGGQSALICAAMSRATATVKFLLSKGANPNYHPAPFWSPLEYATTDSYADEDIAKMLRKAGGKARSKAALAKEEKEYEEKLRHQDDAEKQKIAKADPQLFAVTEDDVRVIEVALADLLDNKKDPFMAGEKPEPNLLVFDSIGGDSYVLSDDQLNADLRGSHANDVSLEIRKSLHQRNAGSSPLKQSQFMDSRLVIHGRDLGLKPGSRASNQFNELNKLKARAWVGLHLPGYSADKGHAVLIFSFGPTAHGATGAVYLSKKDGKWIVTWRDISYFA